jgi:hypothetical protein
MMISERMRGERRGCLAGVVHCRNAAFDHLSFLFMTRMSFPTQREIAMLKLKTPTVPVFLIALALLALAMVGNFATVPFISHYPFWLAIGGYVVLALGSIL